MQSRESRRKAVFPKGKARRSLRGLSPRASIRGVSAGVGSVGKPSNAIDYPVIETSVSWWHGGTFVDAFVPQCCFQDLYSADDTELAGIGLTIIGNICQFVHQKHIPMEADASLALKYSSFDKGTPLPWPGMESDNPNLGLWLNDLPFDYTMMNEDGNFERLVDRQALMKRIEAVWVPHVKGLLNKDVPV